MKYDNTTTVTWYSHGLHVETHPTLLSGEILSSLSGHLRRREKWRTIFVTQNKNPVLWTKPVVVFISFIQSWSSTAASTNTFPKLFS